MAALASDWLRYFRLLLWNRWTELNETWQEARSQRPLPSLCILGQSEKQDGRLGLWLAETFSTSPLINRWTELNETWQEARSQRPLQSLCFLGRSEKKMAALASDWPRHLRLLLWNRWTEFMKTWHEARSQCPLQSLCFSGRSEKTRWLPWPLIGWDIFNFSSETAERNLTKLHRKQDLNVLYQVCVFRINRKNKMAALVSDWLRYFRLLLWNSWTELNETWQGARSQRPLPSLCFSGRWEKQDGCPGFWLAETFSTSPLKLLNGICWNLTGSKISMSFTKFVFFEPIGKTRWPPWPLDWLRHFRLLLFNHALSYDDITLNLVIWYKQMAYANNAGRTIGFSSWK